MTLTPGTRLGAYDVTAQIGERGPAFARALRELRRGLAEAREKTTTMIGRFSAQGSSGFAIR